MGNINEEQNVTEVAEDVVETETEISDEVASQIEQQLLDKQPLTAEPVVEPVVEPIAEQEAETHELHPFVTSWKEQLQAISSIQDQWEKWSLEVLEQQAAFSQGLMNFLPQHELFAPAHEAVKTTCEQVQSSTRSFFDQSRQARSEWLDRAETSTLQFQKMGQLFCPYK